MEEKTSPVLYEIEEKSTQMTSEVRENPAGIKTELENVIKNIDESEMRNILLELALKDNSLQNLILTKYVDKISPGQMSRLKQEVEMIANSCYEYWKQILDQATDEQRKQMFQWFKGRPQN